MNTLQVPSAALERSAASAANIPGSVGAWLAPLEALAENSPHFLSKSLGEFDRNGRAYTLPRYVYLGPKGGGDTIRLGLFAGIHGDEPEGILALTRFVQFLEANRDAAKDYALFIYPACNPTGIEDGTRVSRAGKDLNREFWRRSSEPEVRFLESEICLHAFHGIVTLHSDNTSDGLYGFANGPLLSEYLLEPALRAAETVLPRNQQARIDGFTAYQGIIYDLYQGALRALPGFRPSPFEITFETPQETPITQQAEAGKLALLAILKEYREFIAYAQNI